MWVFSTELASRHRSSVQNSQATVTLLQMLCTPDFTTLSAPETTADRIFRSVDMDAACFVNRLSEVRDLKRFVTTAIKVGGVRRKGGREKCGVWR